MVGFRRINRILQAIGLCSLVFTAGCVIPLPAEREPEPFAQEKTGAMKSGLTTRAAVLKQFGNPTFRTTNDNLYVYHADHRVGYALYLVPFASDFDEITNDFSLIVEFTSAGTVKHFEVLNGFVAGLAEKSRIKRPKYCRVGGMCVLTMHKGIINVFDPAKDARAKRFERNPQRCVVYIARGTRSWFTDIIVDGRHILTMGKNNLVFARLELATGSHEMRGDPRLTDRNFVPTESFSFNCRNGDVLYILSHRVSRGTSRPGLVTAETAQPQIRELYLTPSWQRKR